MIVRKLDESSFDINAIEGKSKLLKFKININSHANLLENSDHY